MSPRFGEVSERFRDYWSRVGLRDRPAQLTLAGTAAVIVILLAIVAWSTSGGDPNGLGAVAAGPGAEGRTTDLTDASEPSLEAPGEATETRGRRGEAGPSAATVSGEELDPAIPVAPPGENAQGVTDTEILVGAAFDRNAGALNQAFGFAGIGQIDQKRAIESVVEYINERGGVGGRDIRVVWHELDQLSGKSEQQNVQEMCTTWTQDNQVFAALAGGNETLDECLTNAGVVSSSAGGGIFDAETMARHPLMVKVGRPAYDRMARFTVDELHAQGYYDSGRSDQPPLPFKLGVVSYDEPVFDRAIEAYKEALAAHGIEVSEVAQIRRAQSEAQIADEVAAIQSAVVRFNSQNVTHVNFLATTNAFLQLMFYSQADHQRYYPRYGVSSQDASQALIPVLNDANGQGTSRRTFTDTVGAGWFPLFDTPRSEYSGDDELPGLRRCKEILSHETFDDPARNKEAIATISCDGLFYLQAAIEAGGQVVNQQTWLQGVSTVEHFDSSATFDARTSATRRDGMSAIRHIAYFGDCDCFKYTSDLKQV